MICFRLLDAKDPAQPLADAVQALAQGAATQDTYAVDPASFRHVPNAPFAYWVSDTIRKLFTTLPPFENEERTAKQGLATADDFRFVRTAWETPITPEELTQRNWYHFAKGGSYSPFYADIHLKVNWADQGNEIKHFGDPSGMKPNSRPQSTDYYFRPGLTWSVYTTKDLSVRALPKNCILSHVGGAAFTDDNCEKEMLFLASSKAFRFLLSLTLGLADTGRRVYGVGSISITPFALSQRAKPNLAISAYRIHRIPDTANANSHAFVAPALAPQKTHLS